MPFGCYKCYSYYPINNCHFEGKCGIGSCGHNIKHNHILCFNCEEYIGICFNCKVYKKKTVTALHHFYKICGIKNCTEKGSHEHYLCKSCKKNAVYEEKGIIH